jgi:hypothetical protein
MLKSIVANGAAKEASVAVKEIPTFPCLRAIVSLAPSPHIPTNLPEFYKLKFKK